MRVAVIGCGSIGRRHIRNLLALGCDVEVHDIDPSQVDRVRAEHPAVTSRKGLWTYTPEAIVIATPIAGHLREVEWVVASPAIPFFVEKPLGTLEQLPQWRRLASRLSIVNQVGYNWRFHEEVEQLHLQAVSPWTAQFESMSDVKAWPGKSYGPPILEASHNIDLAIAWLEALGGTATLQVAQRNRDEAARIVLTNGRDACTVALWFVAPEGRDGDRRFVVNGDGGFWTLQPSPGALEASYRDEMQHFLDCVQSGEQTICPVSEGLKTLEICQQVEQMTRANA